MEPTIFSLNELNDAQRRGAETISGPVLILAGAGSGKTKTVTFRIAHMIQNCNIDSRKILGVTFTNKAAKEMRERATSLLAPSKTKELTLTTFHALAVRILRQDIHHLGMNRRFNIYDTSDQISIVREALKQFKFGDKSFDMKTILAKIGFLKNRSITPEAFGNSPHFDGESSYDHATESVYKYYQNKLKFYNAIDFDDILFLTNELFKKFPDVAKKYSNIYQYIMIDEYQDTNPLQFEIVQGLTSTHNNICVVGDDDQAIYSFRGADITNILSFEKQFPGTKIIKLEANYRSSNEILALANEVIRQNKKRTDKTLRGQKSLNVTPKLWLTANSGHEAGVVVDTIDKKRMEGEKLSNMAVLYRGANQAPPIEDQLILSRIPYKIIGGQKFYDKKEVKDIIAYLHLINNQRDEIALRRALNVPNRGIGMATLQKFLDISAEKKETLFDCFVKYPELSPTGVEKIKHFTTLIGKYRKLFETEKLSSTISSLIEDLSYMEFIEKSYDNPKQVDARKKDVLMFIDSATRFSNYCQGDDSLRNFIEKILLQDSQDKQDSLENEEPRDELCLMSLHSSKGLEFNTVFILGVEEDFLPHKKTLHEGSDISEERRLFYVGITRAKKELYMTYAKERKIFGKDVPRHRSRFLHDIDNKFFKVENCTTFGHMSDEEAEDYKSSFFQNLIDSI